MRRQKEPTTFHPWLLPAFTGIATGANNPEPVPDLTGIEAARQEGRQEVWDWMKQRATKIGTDGGRWSAVNMAAKDYLEVEIHIGREELESQLKDLEITQSE